MDKYFIVIIRTLLIAVALSGCAATIQSTYTPSTDYYEGCQGTWEQLQQCAQENKEKSTKASQTEEVTEITSDMMATIIDTYWGSFRYSKAGISGVNYTSTNFKERVIVPPGRHTVTIHCVHGYGLSSQLYATYREVEFIAKSGHKYQVKCSEADGAWIEDVATEEIVGGPQ